MILAFTVSAKAECNDDWKDKMLSEMVAFYTMEIGLTTEDAQLFWSVYHEFHEKRNEAMRNVFKTLREMEEALEAGKAEKEISKLLEKYLDALRVQREIDSNIAERYLEVLPIEKVAKLYVAEEKFRRQYIRKLHPKPEQEQGERLKK